jgi:glc operon protein GlcG
MYQKMVLGLGEARTVVDAVLAGAQEDPKQPVVVAVVDGEGELIALARMDGTPYLARSAAIRKAYTAARMHTDSAAFGEMARSAGADMDEFGDPMLVGFKGGICIGDGDGVLGAIGVAGRSPDEDETLARAGLGALSI